MALTIYNDTIYNDDDVRQLATAMGLDGKVIVRESQAVWMRTTNVTIEDVQYTRLPLPHIERFDMLAATSGLVLTMEFSQSFYGRYGLLYTPDLKDEKRPLRLWSGDMRGQDFPDVLRVKEARQRMSPKRKPAPRLTDEERARRANESQRATAGRLRNKTNTAEVAINHLISSGARVEVSPTGDLMVTYPAKKGATEPPPNDIIWRS